jgi:hypothetical protein
MAKVLTIWTRPERTRMHSQILCAFGKPGIWSRYDKTAWKITCCFFRILSSCARGKLPTPLNATCKSLSASQSWHVLCFNARMSSPETSYDGLIYANIFIFGSHHNKLSQVQQQGWPRHQLGVVQSSWHNLPELSLVISRGSYNFSKAKAVRNRIWEQERAG